MSDMNLEFQRLLSLIDFAKESKKLNENIVCDVFHYDQKFCAFEHNLKDLPGIHFNFVSDDDEIWFVIERLMPTKPPAPKKLLELWLGNYNNPSREPSLNEAVEYSRLFDAGFIEQAKKLKKDDELVYFKDFQRAEEVQSQFDAYLRRQWKPWAVEEKKQRKSIGLYKKLFELKSELDGSVMGEQIEFVCGVGIVVWQMGNKKVCYPLLTKLVEININSDSLAIEIRPRTVPVALELDIYSAAENPGVAKVQQAFKELANSEKDFSPFQMGSFEKMMRSATAFLDAEGVYWPSKTTADDRALPPFSVELKLTDTWVLFARPRSNDIFVRDLEAFKNQLKNEHVLATLPNAIKAVLNEPVSVAEDVILPGFRGVSLINSGDSGSIADGKVSNLYFPMPFNDEQVRIVQMLECYDGVVVQGPPGTGKTHTIANIIAHYFALGKKVLVTSMKEPALAVLRDKLPEEIRPLAISLLSNEYEGLKQFEFAITKMSSEVQMINKIEYRKEIVLLEQRIDILHGTISKIDKCILQWAKQNLEPIYFEKEAIKPIDAATEVVKAQGHYEWLEDRLLPSNVPDFTNVDIVRLRDARRQIAQDLDYLKVTLPELSSFCDVGDLLSLHHDLIKYIELEQALELGSLLQLVDETKETYETIDALIDKIKKLLVLEQYVKDNVKWLDSALKVLQQTTNIDKLLGIFDALGKDLEAYLILQNNFIAKPITFPKELLSDGEVFHAVENKAHGKLPFGLGGFITKRAAIQKLEQIKILGVNPSTIEDWTYVFAYLKFKKNAQELIMRWNSIAPQLAVPILALDDSTTVSFAYQYYELHRKLREKIALEREIIIEANGLLPKLRLDLGNSKKADWISELLKMLDLHLLHYLLSQTHGCALEKKHKLLKLVQGDGRIFKGLRNFLQSVLGNSCISDSVVCEQWTALLGELKRIHNLRPLFNDIKEICGRIEKSGAVIWSKKLQTQPVNTTVDPLLPDHWRESWRLKCLCTYLDKIEDRDEIKKLTEERYKAEQALQRTNRVLVARLTWLTLADNATSSVRSAFEAFRNAVSKIGKGTGKRAAMWRFDARNAAALASQAIPCWIMPHWKVSEFLPAEFGCFDLVIIDEASQSDLSALPALLRAKKVLIVGDDKQVSPDGGFIIVEKIKQLKERYLTNHVDIFRAQMDPGQSIYDLFKVVFAKSSTMLREHFRCVGPIIEYSKREVYNHELKPVRIAKASERLDPPLVDVLIEDGYRKGDINFPEARYIVDEIKKICDDPSMKNRTIGVISLLADKQALKIREMLSDEVTQEKLTQHKIICGDARTFQGEERDIIFLSMVVTGSDVVAQTRDSIAQRFNVAMSRARDRMYLIRSVEMEQLSIKDTLRRNILKHFTMPYAHDEERVEDLRTLCESDFEKEVYDILTERGYRVIPQVKVGEYRIDMVVEGNNDTRIAIECDGDQYHGLDRWDQDMRRQRVLERVGWQFWRSFASDFVKNKTKVVTDLFAILKKKGIEPIGHDQAPRSVHTELRRVTVLQNSESTYTEHE